MAYFAYRRYWRSLGSGLCHEPLGSPVSDVSARRSGVRREPPKDEEEGVRDAGDFDLDELTEDEAERGLLDSSGQSSPKLKQKGRMDDTGGGSGSQH